MMQARDALPQEPQGARVRSARGCSTAGLTDGQECADTRGCSGHAREGRGTASPQHCRSAQAHQQRGACSRRGRLCVRPPTTLQRGGRQTLLPGSTVQRTHGGPGGCGEGSRQREALTICLHGCSPLHQVVGQLHGVGRAQRELPREPDDQNAHQRVLQDGHLRAEAEEEAAGRGAEAGSREPTPGPQGPPTPRAGEAPAPVWSGHRGSIARPPRSHLCLMPMWTGPCSSVQGSEWEPGPGGPQASSPRSRAPRRGGLQRV